MFLNGHRSLWGFASKNNVKRKKQGKLNLHEHSLYTHQGFSSEGLTRTIQSSAPIDRLRYQSLVDGFVFTCSHLDIV